MICLDNNDLLKFDIIELKKLLEILIQSEKFEYASVIKNEINKRKKYYNIAADLDDDNLNDENFDI
jgi:protein-arginine kinase activator protein McsA